MKVGNLCNCNPVTIRESIDLTAAAELMREKHIGYLVVVQPNPAEGTFKPVGVLTDRDIVVSVVARQTDPRALRAGDVMTRQPVLVEEGTSLSSALRMMREIGVRRLPVVAHAGHLIGVLSLDDILGALAGELQDLAGAVRNELRIESALRP